MPGLQKQAGRPWEAGGEILSPELRESAPEGKINRMSNRGRKTNTEITSPQKVNA